MPNLLLLALLQVDSPLSNYRGQCYDGASNISEAKGGVAAQLTAIESRVLYTHCYCHALNLAIIVDTIKQSKTCRMHLRLLLKSQS